MRWSNVYKGERTIGIWLTCRSDFLRGGKRRIKWASKQHHEMQSMATGWFGAESPHTPPHSTPDTIMDVPECLAHPTHQ